MCGSKKRTGSSHNKNTKTYNSACQQQAQQQSVLFAQQQPTLFDSQW